MSDAPIPPPPPEPPASQPPLPPAPPPADFPTSSDQAEANFRTTGTVVWAVIGALLLAGLGLIALGARDVSAPRLTGESGFGFNLPDFDLPRFEMPDIRMPDLDVDVPDARNDGEGADKVENPPNVSEVPDVEMTAIEPSDPDPVGERVDKPAGDRPAR